MSPLNSKLYTILCHKLQNGSSLRIISRFWWKKVNDRQNKLETNQITGFSLIAKNVCGVLILNKTTKSSACFV